MDTLDVPPRTQNSLFLRHLMIWQSRLQEKGIEVSTFSIKYPLHTELKQPWIEFRRYPINKA